MSENEIQEKDLKTENEILKGIIKEESKTLKGTGGRATRMNIVLLIIRILVMRSERDIQIEIGIRTDLDFQKVWIFPEKWMAFMNKIHAPHLSRRYSVSDNESVIILRSESPRDISFAETLSFNIYRLRQKL